jgi:hypothetical protein
MAPVLALGRGGGATANLSRRDAEDAEEHLMARSEPVAAALPGVLRHKRASRTSHHI